MGDDVRSDSPRATDSGAAVPLDVIPLHSTNLLTVLDASGTVQYESPSIERVFGYDQEDLVGEQVAEYFHPDDRERVVDAFRAVVDADGNTIEAVEYRHRRADGSFLWVESVASANPTPDGYYVINTRDISDRKVREQDLEDTVGRLDEFAGVVSHDLQNPLNVAKGRLELAREERKSEHLDLAADAVDRSLALIDDLLALSREGRRAGNVERVSLATAADQCWRTVETGNAVLVTEADRTIHADSSRLRQLLENLLRNAIEHGGEEVTVSIGDLDAGFYVADDGPGISEDTRERVFDPGYSTADDGTGFGLQIAEQIADAHGWEISVSESDGGGARFEITGVEGSP